MFNLETAQTTIITSFAGGVGLTIPYMITGAFFGPSIGFGSAFILGACQGGIVLDYVFKWDLKTQLTI